MPREAETVFAYGGLAAALRPSPCQLFAAGLYSAQMASKSSGSISFSRIFSQSAGSSAKYSAQKFILFCFVGAPLKSSVGSASPGLTGPRGRGCSKNSRPAWWTASSAARRCPRTFASRRCARILPGKGLTRPAKTSIIRICVNAKFERSLPPCCRKRC